MSDIETTSSTEEVADSSAPIGPTFADLDLPEPLMKALQAVGYEVPSPIQARTIPLLLGGKDVLGQAATGTGKTAAFALPALAHIDIDNVAPQVMVLTPTRELCIQVAEAFQKYAAFLPGFHVLPIYGGQAYPLQLRPLRRGVHVIVATPGRLMDHMKRGSITTDSLKTLILDEADEMLNMGFLEDVDWILSQLPEKRQMALFSATMPRAIQNIANNHMREPELVHFQSRASAADTITQRFQIIPQRNKIEALTRLLEVEPFEAMIIFVRTKIATMELAEKLEARGHAAAPLNGDIPQNHREMTVDKLKARKLDILVATDVAARGLDVPHITHVINYDAPTDTEAYVHRIGRTGRAGKKGDAILFITPRERRLLNNIERNTGSRIERLVLPTNAEVNKQRIDRFKAKITEALSSDSKGFYGQIVDEYIEEHETDPKALAAALAGMAQGDQPLLLPEKEERNFDESFDKRDNRPQRGGDRPHPLERPTEPGMDRYRIEVGYKHGASPGSVVGAIANEADINGRDIGRIEIYDFFATVDLPERMPREIFNLLTKTRVCNQELRLTKVVGGSQHRGGGGDSFGGGGGGGGRRGFSGGRRGGFARRRRGGGGPRRY
jgi:ATP-dependent RNA helicase DeaD